MFNTFKGMPLLSILFNYNKCVVFLFSSFYVCLVDWDLIEIQD